MVFLPVLGFFTALDFLMTDLALPVQDFSTALDIFAAAGFMAGFFLVAPAPDFLVEGLAFLVEVDFFFFQKIQTCPSKWSWQKRSSQSRWDGQKTSC